MTEHYRVNDTLEPKLELMIELQKEMLDKQEKIRSIASSMLFWLHIWLIIIAMTLAKAFGWPFS